jgi:hypothetical protein
MPEARVEHLSRIAIPDFDVPEGRRVPAVIAHLDRQIEVLDLRSALLDALRRRERERPPPRPDPERPASLGDVVARARQMLREAQQAADATELQLRGDVLVRLREAIRR